MATAACAVAEPHQLGEWTCLVFCGAEPVTNSWDRALSGTWRFEQLHDCPSDPTRRRHTQTLPIQPLSQHTTIKKKHWKVLCSGLHAQLAWPRTTQVPEAQRNHERFGNRLENSGRRSQMPFLLPKTPLFWLFLAILGTKRSHFVKNGEVSWLWVPCGGQDLGRPKLKAKCS